MKIISNPSLSALLSASAFFVAALLIFTLFEPVVSRAQVQAEDQFTIEQTIVAEISFLAPTDDVTMDGTIAGQTGGITNGQTQVRVLTNNPTGYSMTIDFASSSYGVAAMNRNGGGGYISDYVVDTPGTPDFTFDSTATFAQLGYTVSASTTGELDTTFRNNGSVCNNDTGGDVAASCWYGPAQAAETVINTTSATAPSGSTSTIHFRVDVPNNPSPALPAGTYTATATLTAITN